MVNSEDRPKRHSRKANIDGWYTVTFTWTDVDLTSTTRVPATTRLRAMIIGKERLEIPASARGCWQVRRD